MVSTYFPTPKEPWRCSFVYDQTRAIREEGDYDVVTIKPDYAGTYEFRGVKVVGFQRLMTGAWLCPWLIGWLNARRMFKALKDAGIDIRDVGVAHGQLVPMGAYLRALKQKNADIKTILQFQDPDPYGMLFGEGRLGWLKRAVYFAYHRWLVEQMDVLVGISKNVAKVVAEAPRQTVYNTYEPMKKAMHDLRWFRPARVKPAYVLHNGVNQEIFSPSSQPQPRTSTFTIGCVAVFRDWKDQLTLLRAVDKIKDKIPNLCVKLVGVHHSGTMLADCQKLIADKNLPAEIIPSMDHKALPDFYRSIDLFVLPSFFEGFGCVLTEAWSCGTPFITCEGQAMDDLIYPDDRKLWLVKQQDAGDLAKKIWYYYINRPGQRLSGSVNINEMNRNFLKACELLK